MLSVTRASRDKSGVMRALRAAAALAVAGIGIVAAGLIAARPMREDELERWMGKGIDRADVLRILGPESTQFVFIGPVFIPRAGFAWLAGTLLIAAVLLLALAGRRRDLHEREMRSVDPWALLLCVPASFVAAWAWVVPVPSMVFVFFLANLAAALTAYGIATLLISTIPWPPRATAPSQE